MTFEPSGLGWTANIPGFGLLADQFPEPALHIWTYDTATMAPAPVRAGRPGAAEAVRRHDRRGARPSRACTRVVPPRRVGGNMDIRDLAAGTVLYLPVEVAGRAVLGRRHPRRAGRRRGLRHGDREPDERGADVRPGQGRQPASRRASPPPGPVTPPSRRQGLRGDDRHRPRPDGRRARRGRAA